MVVYPDLEKKKILVTGATRGIGRAIALALARGRANVAFSYREGKESVAKELATELEKCGAASVYPLLLDLTRTDQLQENLGCLVREWGPVEGLVNNAGLASTQLLLRMKKSDLDLVLDTNLKGAIMVTQSLSRGFLKVKSVSVVNISSVVGVAGNPGQIAYAASKAGLIGFTKALAKEWGGKNVRCNALCPGFIETDMTSDLGEETQKSYLSAVALNRFGTPDDVASAVSFLLSDASSYITGQAIRIDGGLSI